MKLFNVFILLIVGSLQVIFAQNNCQRSSCKWEFFNLKKTLQGEVIYHEKRSCVHRVTTSITILKVKNETIRILSSCDDRSYDVGEKIYVTTGAIFSRFNFKTWVVGIPAKKKRGWRKEYKEAEAKLPSRFDKLVLKTTIGILSDQSDCERSSNIYKAIHSNSFQCHWDFFQIEKSIEGTIIKYEAQVQPCHLITYASLAIVAINNNQDTIRVLSCCNMNSFKEGAKVIIEAGEYKSPISIPYTKSIEKNREIHRSNEYDRTVFRTTYGKIINRQ